MLSKLSIKNYALIRELELTPSQSLNIVTGETGAGKSIMLGAIGLLLGKRADTKILLSKESKCVIEGEFDISRYNLLHIFEAADLDYEDLTIIRREINPNGKSRAFVNDIPTTLDVLKKLGLKLLDIHSQNESLAISRKETKLSIVDNYAGAQKLNEQFSLSFVEYRSNEKALENLLAQQKDFKKEEDYNHFLLDELVKANFLSGEQEDLESELKVLDHAEEIKTKLSQVANEFQNSDLSISDRLAEHGSLLRSISQHSPNLEKLHERYISSLTELKDVVGEIEVEIESVEHNPARTDEINERLSLLYQLQQKHSVRDIDELLAIQQELENKVMATQNLEESIEKAEGNFKKSKQAMIAKAETLSEKRRSSLDKFSSEINQLLAYVGMPDGRLEIAYKRIEPSATGIDEVEILFSANKGIPPQPVASVASGGEFSRLMLCIKYLLATKTSMPTIIFDEIDTGVSGEIAIKVATLMKKMSTKHQVIAISHLPQIAAKADAHYYVYKDNQSQTTESLIKKLDNAAHVEEIARMIGGEKPTEAALKNARELIEG